MSVRFKGIALDGKLNILNQVDLETYCREMQGKELMIEITQYNRSGVKARMMAYYFAVVLKAAVAGWREIGEAIDDVEADYRLRAELAKIHRKDQKGNFIIVLEDKREMNRDRLLQYLQDCIYFVETNLKYRVPDSSEYIAMKKTGKKYTAVNGDKE